MRLKPALLVFFIAATGLACTAAVLTDSAILNWMTLQDSACEPGSIRQLKRTPLRLSFALPASTLSNAQRTSLISILNIPEGSRFSDVLHAARACNALTGSACTHRYLEVVKSIESNQLWFGGRSSFTTTSHGVSVRTSADSVSQAHFGHALSVLAESGVPLEASLGYLGREVRVADLLADDIMMFDLGNEIEWSCLAYALYLPPQRNWKNRFGEEFDFDKVVTFLMSRPFEAASCSGTHALYTLSAIVSADNKRVVLNRSIRSKLDAYLGRIIEELMTVQRPDGAWDSDWYYRLVNTAWYKDIASGELEPPLSVRAARQWYDSVPRGDQNEISLLLVTGHHLEWIAILPRETFPIDNGVVLKANAYLMRALERVAPETIKSSFCPSSHAARILLMSAVASNTAGSL